MFILELYLSLHELTCLLGLHNLHSDPYLVCSYLLFCLTILNDATVYVYSTYHVTCSQWYTLANPSQGLPTPG